MSGMIHFSQGCAQCVSKGFTLIEALVAIFLVAVGLLGVSLMSLNSLAGTSSSYMRSIATVIATDVQEYAWIQLENNDGDCDLIDVAELESMVHDAWSSESAAYDERVTLPGLNLEVSEVDCVFDVVVEWAEARFVQQDNVDSFEYEFELPKLR